MVEKNTTAKVIVTVAVTTLLMVALITSIASEAQKRTTSLYTADEIVDISSARLAANEINISQTFTLANAPTGWKANNADCNVVALAYSNASNDFTVTTDYTVSTAGVLTLVNSTAMIESPENTTYIDYTTCDDGYLTESWSRTVLNLAPGMFAIAILLAVIAGAYVLLNKEKED